MKLPEVWYYDATLKDSGKSLTIYYHKNWNWIQITHIQVIIKLFYCAVTKNPNVKPSCNWLAIFHWNWLIYNFFFWMNSFFILCCKCILDFMYKIFLNSQLRGLRPMVKIVRKFCFEPLNIKITWSLVKVWWDSIYCKTEILYLNI